MKKALVTFISIFLLSITYSTAQSSYRPALQKGSIMLNGSAALSFGNTSSDYSSQGYSSSQTANYNSFSLSPQFSGFIANGFAIGLIFDLTQISNKTETPNAKSTYTQFTAGPTLKYYLPKGFFFQGSAAFGKNTYKYSEDPDPNDGSNISKWQLGAGYAIFLNNHISIEPGMLFRSTSQKEKETNFTANNKLNEFVFNIGLNIFLHKKGE